MSSFVVHERRKRKHKSPGIILKENLLQLVKDYNTELPADINDIPTKWEKHGDLVLIPSDCLKHNVWQNIGAPVWDAVAESLKCQRVARKHAVKCDDFRSPCVEFLKGEDGWVTRIDDGIKMSFDVTKCMFSTGNITEKLRISKFSCAKEIVVDLYAGIGYFVLPYLVHAKAAEVHACEWNPDAVEALKKNLELNKVQDRCIIHFGDNKKVCPKGIADRVNLGLIPSSEQSWLTACEALKPMTGGILHIHANVTSGLNCKPNLLEVQCLSLSGGKKRKTEWCNYAEATCSTISLILKNLYHKEWAVSIMNIEHVKPYAPRIDHVVIDIKCEPS